MIQRASRKKRKKDSELLRLPREATGCVEVDRFALADSSMLNSANFSRASVPKCTDAGERGAVRRRLIPSHRSSMPAALVPFREMAEQRDIKRFKKSNAGDRPAH